MSRTYAVPIAVVVLGLGVFGLVATFVTPGPIGPDAEYLRLVEQARTETWTRVMTAITYFGSGPVTVALVLALMVAIGIKRATAEAVFLLVANAGGWILSLVVKSLFERPRPPPDVVSAITDPQSFAFPSGHSLIAMVFYTSLVMVASGLGRKGLAVWLTALAAIMVPTMGFTRVYLGVHYPSDVVAGFGLGAAWVWFVYLCYRIERRR